jgi:hypothetical protein
MPRRFLDSDKRRWLELYESGKTERCIARQYARCDPRTVKRGIEEARRRQDVRVARMEILKEALRKHQESLLEELDSIASSLLIPNKDLVVLSWRYNGDSIFNKPETVLERQAIHASKTPRISRNRVEGLRGLLKQHLKNHRLWKALAQWENAYAEHVAARIALQQKAVALLEERTGYKLVDSDDVSPPFLYSETTGDLFLKRALWKAFGVYTWRLDLQSDIVANTNTGDVSYHRMILAVAPGSEEKTRMNLLDALGALEALPEVSTVVDTYEPLEKIVTQIRQMVEQIKLMGLIPGQCEICRRLGM